MGRWRGKRKDDEMGTEISVRGVQLPEDADGLRLIDTSYVSDREYVAIRSGRELHFGPRDLGEQQRHGFDALAGDLDRTDRLWSDGFVATTGSGVIVGFIAAGFESWNRRLRIWHLYVSPNHRRLGIARRLYSTVAALGRQLAASHLFVETPNINAPAIATYERLGLQIVGFDSSLYDATPAQGEIAVYLAQRL
jgi:ribosomal protein S18 acetylase RimI-like enzyme